MDNQKDTQAMPELMFVKFADAEVPQFKEVPNKDFILFGKDNLYPEYLLWLYNKSGKHGAIINGKSKYIAGSGFKSRSITKDFTLPAINGLGETWDDVAKKAIKDVEIFGGARLFVVWDLVGRIKDITHTPFHQVRRGKDGGFLFKRDWKQRGDARQYPEFDINNRKGVQIFAYDEYRPGTDTYPLPEYLPCNNYIETDIEISKFHLSAIKNGMMPSKAIEFYTGEPTDEKKREIEQRISRKFAGAENAGKFLMFFSQSKEKAVNITDLSASELDKQFDLLNKTCEQEIFTGHQVVSPMLFGIKTEGQLGGSNELKTAFEIFINTYAKPKQADWERIANYFSAFCGQTADLYIEQLDPVGLQIAIDAVVSILPKEFIFEKLNVPKEYWNLPTPTNTGAQVPTSTVAQEDMVNDHIKNLTGKQQQQVERLIRKYSNGTLTKQAATALLKAGYGLSDDTIAALLGIEDEAVQMAAAFADNFDEDEIIQMFNACGDLKSDYNIIKSKKVKFSSDEDAADDEELFFTQAFKKNDVTVSEKQILDLISKDKHITPEVIANALGTTAEYVTSKIASLVKRGYLLTDTEMIGEDEVPVRELGKPYDEALPPGESDSVEISIKYSYEGPQDSRNRPFCAKLMKLDRLYSRFEIEQISQRLGYSVFDRRGGFWRHKDGTITPYCRHNWKSNVIVRKGTAA